MFRVQKSCKLGNSWHGVIKALKEKKSTQNFMTRNNIVQKQG